MEETFAGTNERTTTATPFLQRTFAFGLTGQKLYTYLVLCLIMSLYVIEMIVLSSHVGVIEAAPIHHKIMFALATLMGARTIAIYGVMEWFRRPFTREVADSCGAGA